MDDAKVNFTELMPDAASPPALYMDVVSEENGWPLPISRGNIMRITCRQLDHRSDLSIA